MSAINSESIGYPPRRQRGAALLVTLIILVLLSSAILLDRLNAVATPTPFGDRKSGEALVRAKDALIAWAAAHPDTPGLLPFPDRNDDTIPDYDGTADCVNAVSLAPGDLLGRFPIQGEQTGAGCARDIGMSVTVEDSAGERLWYAVSRNLVRGGGGGPINPDIGDVPAQPWITVRDQTGVPISSRVAAVIIAPGPALAGQDRRIIDSNPAVEYAKYLESVTIGPDTFNNADADGCLDDDVVCTPPSGEDFIIYPKTTDAFNDRLVFITIDELMRAVEDRVLGEAAQALKFYRASGDIYPWLAPFSDPRPKKQGVATGGSATSLVDTRPGTDFTAAPAVAPGDLVRNLTDGSARTVTAVAPQTLSLFSQGLAGGTNNSFAADDAYVIESPGVFDAVVGTLAGFLPMSFPGEIFQTGFTVNWNFSGEKNDDVGGDLSLQPTVAEVDGGGFGDLTIPDSQGTCKWTTTNRVDCRGWAFLPGQGTGGSNRTVEVSFNFTADTTTIVAPTATAVRRRNHTYNGNNDADCPLIPGACPVAAPDLPQETWSVRITDDDGVLTPGWRLAVRDASTDLVISKFEGIRYEQIDAQDPNFDLPPWFAQNNWHYFVHVVISGAHAPVLGGTSTGDGICTPLPASSDDACLTIRYDSAGTPVDVRDDVEAVVIGSGPELSVVLSQNRAASPTLSDYFEAPNIDGDLILGRAVRNTFETNSTFNDQIRAVPP